MAGRATLLCDELVARLVVVHLPRSDLFHLLATCRALHTVEGIEISLPKIQSACDVLEWSRRFGTRYTITECDLSPLSRNISQVLAAPGLKRLTSRGQIGSLEAVAQAASLQSLRLLQCSLHQPLDVSPMGRCRSLLHVAIHHSSLSSSTANRFGGLDALGDCHQLQSVELKRASREEACRLLQGLAQGGAAWSLVSCMLVRRELEATDLSPSLARLRCLRVLDLSLNDRLASTTPLGECGSLQSLSLNGCRSLEDVAALAYCKRLETLYLGGCVRLRDVTPLLACTALKMLHVNQCRALVDVGALGAMSSLERLNVRNSGVRIVPQREGLRVSWDTDTSAVPGVL